MATGHKYGDLMPPTYLGIGDPYLGGKTPQNSRNTGLNFKATRVKTGKYNDALLNKFDPLFKGEKYDQLDHKAIAERREARKKLMASERPFRPSAPMKLSSGLGDYFGTIGSKIEHKAEGDEKAKKKGDFPPGPRNVLTNPPKKGSFGYIKTTLSERQGFQGVAGEYAYKPDKFEQARIDAREEYLASVKARVTEKPFKPSNPSKRGNSGFPGITLGGKGKGVVGEYAYVEQGAKKKEALAKLEKAPFYPSKYPKEGYNCTFEKPPAYIEDPLDLKALELKKQREAGLAARTNDKPFRPSFDHRTKATVSIVRKELENSVLGHAQADE